MAIMSKSVQKELRRRYGEIWGKDWEEGNALLSELWFEAKAALGVSAVSKQNGAQVKAETLGLMREAA